MKCSIKVKAKHLGLGLSILITPTAPFIWSVRRFFAGRLITAKRRELALKYGWTSKLIHSLISHLFSVLRWQIMLLISFNHFSITIFSFRLFSLFTNHEIRWNNKRWDGFENTLPHKCCHILSSSTYCVWFPGRRDWWRRADWDPGLEDWRSD